MDIQELMKLERQKAVIRSLSELEIALNTFYDSDSRFEGLNDIYKQLKEFKEGYLD